MVLKIIDQCRKENEIIKQLKKYTDLFEVREQDVCEVRLSRQKSEGYEISRWDEGYCISYGTYSDLCRALMFLAGEQKHFTENVNEKCSFHDFGIMLDLSRNAVLRLETVKRMICYAACMGYQFIGLYMEDTFQVEKEPYLGYMRGRMTQDEIRELDCYTKVFGMELRPYIQTLAHLNQITRYERYQEIIDTKDILFAGNEKTEIFIDHILENLRRCFSTNIVNIGMDEAELLGAGKYLQQNGYEKKSKIMTEHLRMVLRLCKKYNFKVQMWSDMFVHMTENGDWDFDIPSELQIVYWDYYSTDEKHYEEKLREQKKISKNLGFAGGAWKWTGFVPHNAYSIRTGEASVQACRKCGIDSYTVTCWGDDGAEASCFSVLPALYEDAAMAYESRMKKNAFKCLTGYKLEDFLAIDLVNPYLENGKIHNNSSKYLLYNDPLIGTFDSVVKNDTVKRFEKAEERMKKNTAGGELNYIFKTMQLLCAVLKRKTDLGIRIRKAYKEKDMDSLRYLATHEIPVIQLALAEFYTVFESQWKKENKAFGFEVQTIRIGGLKQRLTDTQRQLRQYAEGELEKIEELEEEYLPFAYFEKNNIEELNYNLWSDIVSPNVAG